MGKRRESSRSIINNKNNKTKNKKKINTRRQGVTYGKKLLHSNMINGRIVACTYDCQLSNVCVFDVPDERNTYVFITLKRVQPPYPTPIL